MRSRYCNLQILAEQVTINYFKFVSTDYSIYLPYTQFLFHFIDYDIFFNNYDMTYKRNPKYKEMDSCLEREKKKCLKGDKRQGQRAVQVGII